MNRSTHPRRVNLTITPFLLPRGVSERMVNFLDEADLGPLFSHEGETISDDLKDVLVFLSPEVERPDGQIEENRLYRVSSYATLISLLTVYARLNLVPLASDNKGKNPDEYDTSKFGVDDLMLKYFTEDLEEIVAEYSVPSTGRQGYTGPADSERRVDLSNFTSKVFGKLVMKNKDTETRAVKEFSFADSSVADKRRARRYIDKIDSYPKDEYVPSLEVAAKMVGVDLDDIKRVYEINPLLYFLSIDRYTVEYVRNTIKVLNKMGAESIHKQRERGGVLAKRAQ